MSEVWNDSQLFLGGCMINKMERIKNEFMEVLLRRDGQVNRTQIDVLNEYTQFVAQKLEEMNENYIVYNPLS